MQRAGRAGTGSVNAMAEANIWAPRRCSPQGGWKNGARIILNAPPGARVVTRAPALTLGTYNIVYSKRRFRNAKLRLRLGELAGAHSEHATAIWTIIKHVFATPEHRSAIWRIARRIAPEPQVTRVPKFRLGKWDHHGMVRFGRRAPETGGCRNLQNRREHSGAHAEHRRVHASMFFGA